MLRRITKPDRFARLRGTLGHGASPGFPWKASERPLTTLLAVLSAGAVWFTALYTLVFSDTSAERWHNFAVSGSASLAIIGMTALVHRAEARRPLFPSFLSRALSVGGSVGASAMLVLAACLMVVGVYRTGAGAVKGMVTQATWSKPSLPYSARVTGFIVHSSRRSRSQSPVVEITFVDGRKEKFASPHASHLGLFFVGEAVEVLAPRTSAGLAWPEQFEIDSAFHLWIEDVISLAVLLMLPMWIGVSSFRRYRSSR